MTGVSLWRLTWNVLAIGVGLIMAWYWMLYNVPWGILPPALTFSVLLNFSTGIYIPVLFWGILHRWPLRVLGATTAAILIMHLYSQTDLGRAIWEAFGPGVHW